MGNIIHKVANTIKLVKFPTMEPIDKARVSNCGIDLINKKGGYYVKLQDSDRKLSYEAFEIFHKGKKNNIAFIENINTEFLLIGIYEESKISGHNHNYKNSNLKYLGIKMKDVYVTKETKKFDEVQLKNSVKLVEGDYISIKSNAVRFKLLEKLKGDLWKLEYPVSIEVLGQIYKLIDAENIIDIKYFDEKVVLLNDKFEKISI